MDSWIPVDYDGVLPTYQLRYVRSLPPCKKKPWRWTSWARLSLVRPRYTALIRWDDRSTLLAYQKRFHPIRRVRQQARETWLRIASRREIRVPSFADCLHYLSDDQLILHVALCRLRWWVNCENPRKTGQKPTVQASAICQPLLCGGTWLCNLYG